MAIWFIRCLFVLASGGVAYQIASCFEVSPFWGIVIGALVGGMIVAIEALFSRQPLSLLSSIIFGLILGCLVANLVFNVVVLALGPEANLLFGFKMETTQVGTQVKSVQVPRISRDEFESMLKLALTCLFSYLGISLIHQTKDRFNFVIPYVEFKKQVYGARPLILDTSVLIDGRIVEMAETNIIDNRIVIPRFVLQELQDIADSSDKLKRIRGRRGLSMLEALRRTNNVDVEIYDAKIFDDKEPVDNRLLKLAKALDGKIVTNDFNLKKVAELQDIPVINIHELANALRPAAVPGEEITLALVKPGEAPDQGVGYLDDGTMVVVEQGRHHIGKEVSAYVTGVHSTTMGRMIFAKLREH